MRHPDWQIRLEAFVSERMGAPFVWGSNDCALFAADAVLAMTGADYAEEHRGHSTSIGAARAVKSGGGLQAMATKSLGDPIPTAFARPGDVVLLVVQGRSAFGICNGTTAIGPGLSEIVAVSMADAVAAWRVE